MRIKMTNSTSDNIESLPAKELYEAAISRSEHAPQSKIVSEFVLDALVNSSGESAQIRELRASIRKAIDEANDDKAHDLMSELKKSKMLNKKMLLPWLKSALNSQSLRFCPVSALTQPLKKSCMGWR